MFWTASLFVRITVRDKSGVTHGEDLPLNLGDDYEEVFRWAHSRPDGQVPPAAEIGDRMWQLCVRLRALEARLLGRCALADLRAAGERSDGAAIVAALTSLREADAMGWPDVLCAEVMTWPDDLRLRVMRHTQLGDGNIVKFEIPPAA